MSDPPKKRRGMSQTERDLQGLDARAERETAAELARAASHSDGVVKDEEDNENVTSPVELLDRPTTEEEVELIAHLSRASTRPMTGDSPVTLRQFVKLVTRVNSIKVEERRNHKNTSDRIFLAMGEKPPAEQFAELRQLIEDGSAKPTDVAEVAKQIRAMKWKVNAIWGVLMIALTAAGGSTVAVVRWLKDSGKNELQEQQMIDRAGEHERRIRSIEDLSNRNASRIDDHIQGHRSGSRTRDLTPDPPATKLAP